MCKCKEGSQPSELRGRMPPAKAVSQHDDRPAAWTEEVRRMHGVSYIFVQKVLMCNIRLHGAPKGNTGNLSKFFLGLSEKTSGQTISLKKG